MVGIGITVKTRYFMSDRYNTNRRGIEMNHQVFQTAQQSAEQLAKDIAYQLQTLINSHGKAYLAVSGGSTPVPFFAALSEYDIEWSKVAITLIDERWVDESDPKSNAALVRRHLLQNKAVDAYFLPVYNSASSPEDGYMQCENASLEQFPRCDLAVLGMGLDGHTASWFPGSKHLAACFDQGSAARYCPITDAPQTCPRMTLTWSWLAECQQLYLHFDGGQKTQLLEQILAAGEKVDFEQYPVTRLIYQTASPISIYRS